MSWDGLYNDVILSLSRALSLHKGGLAFIKQREIYRQSPNPHRLRKHAATVSKLLAQLRVVEDTAGRVWVLVSITRSDVKNYVYRLVAASREG